MCFTDGKTIQANATGRFSCRDLRVCAVSLVHPCTLSYLFPAGNLGLGDFIQLIQYGYEYKLMTSEDVEANTFVRPQIISPRKKTLIR